LELSRAEMTSEDGLSREIPGADNRLPQPPAEGALADQSGGMNTGVGSLSEEERMLLKLRDELYEGSWEQFVMDLKARLAGEPYVFEIGSSSDRLKETINHHLSIITKLKEVEMRMGINLNIMLDNNT